MRVHANAACSVDLRVAAPDGSPRRFSGRRDMERVHALRASADAVVVGIGTVRADNPRLTARPVSGPPARQPLRVVVDARLRTPPGARVCDGEAPTLIATAGPVGALGRAEVRAFPGAEGRVDLPALLAELAARGVRSVLLEGGPTLLASFLEGRLVDRLTLYVAPALGRRGPLLLAHTDPLAGLDLVGTTRLDDGVLFEWARGPPSRFLCDEMLGHLARDLRVLGFDTAYAKDAADTDILLRARAEGRRLLTRDRVLAGRAASDALLVCSLEPAEQLREVVEGLGLRPSRASFLSRCTVCNGELEALAGAPAGRGVPSDVEGRPLHRCLSCGHVYWEGTHVAAMRERLGRFLQ